MPKAEAGKEEEQKKKSSEDCSGEKRGAAWTGQDRTTHQVLLRKEVTSLLQSLKVFLLSLCPLGTGLPKQPAASCPGLHHLPTKWRIIWGVKSSYRKDASCSTPTAFYLLLFSVIPIYKCHSNLKVSFC